MCITVSLIIPRTESPAGHLCVESWQNEQKWCDRQDLSGLWCYRKPAASLGGYAFQPTQACGSMAHVTLLRTGGLHAGLETHAKAPIHKQNLLKNLQSHSFVPIFTRTSIRYNVQWTDGHGHSFSFIYNHPYCFSETFNYSLHHL